MSRSMANQTGYREDVNLDRFYEEEMPLGGEEILAATRILNQVNVLRTELKHIFYF